MDLLLQDNAAWPGELTGVDGRVRTGQHV
jgi:hypothetical protein